MRIRGRLANLAVALVAVTALASGCTGLLTGSPTSDETPPKEPATSAPASSAPASPVPATHAPISDPVDLAKVKPCALFTAKVYEAALLEQDGPPVEGDVVNLPSARACFRADPDINRSLRVAVVPDTGLDAFAATFSTGIEEFSVAGYPAITVAVPGKVNCFGAVGLADDQMIYLSYGRAAPESSEGPPESQLCKAVHTIAKVVVAEASRRGHHQK